MARRPTKNPRLSDRDWEILDHLTRYRLTTPEILHRLFFDDSETNATTKVTSRLVRHGFLVRYSFLSQRSYFVIGPAACKIMGLSTKKSKSLGPQALTTEFGTLAYCFNTTPQRKRLKISELHAFDDSLIGHRLDSTHYYFDVTPEQKRLALIRVEQGSTPDHIARRCRTELEKRLEVPVFKYLVDNDQFMIAVVTGTRQKADEILVSIRKQKWPIRFRVETVPELIQLNARTTV